MMNFDVSSAKPLLDESFLSQLDKPFLQGYKAVMSWEMIGTWGIVFMASVVVFVIALLLFRFTFGRFK